LKSWPEYEVQEDFDGEVATERMYLRSDGSLFCRAGVKYPLDMADQLIGESERLGRQL
jgi:hypothetical protein